MDTIDCLNAETIEQLIQKKITRRTLIKSALALPLLSSLSGIKPAQAVADARLEPFSFQPISLSSTDSITVASGFRADVLIRWGDPLLAGAPRFDLMNQSAATQAMQFGYNCDFVHFFPLGSRDSAKRGILAVNHEYTNPELMFPGYDPKPPTKNKAEVQLAAHGLAFFEIELSGTKWRLVANSRYNGRITAKTAMTLHVPAPGHALLKTSSDAGGKSVRGTLSNCGGGFTPWGTLLTAEEHFENYFANQKSLPKSDLRQPIHARYGISEGGSKWRWENHQARFDI